MGKLAVYPILRTYHVERIAEVAHERLLYLKKSYDFDSAALAPGRSVHHTSVPGALLAVAFTRYDRLELPEPLWLRFLPFTAAACAIVRVRRAMRTLDTVVVTYAIENNALDDRYLTFALAIPLCVRRYAVRTLLRFCAPTIDRIAFGSEAAEESYTRAAGGLFAAKNMRVIRRLPSACTECSTASGSRTGVAFIGELHVRKGLARLLQAWPIVRAAHPDAHLSVAGDGPMIDVVREMQAVDHSVTYLGTVNVAQVHGLFSHARVLVLLSQPEARWREQIGLPIVEALAHGCRVIVSTESGMASWICETGGTVLDPRASARELAAAICAVLTSKVGEGTTQLPAVSGIAQAHAWLTSPAPAGV